MAKGNNHLLTALKQGRPFTWTVPDGGDLASMRAVIKHGQTLTLTPVQDPTEVQVGDIVLLKWRGSHILHLVQEIKDGQFLIVNSLGRVNGWVGGEALLGRVTEAHDPEPRPDVPVMIDQLEATYRGLAEKLPVAEEDTRRLQSIVDDLRWYAGRLGPERWDQQPQQNKWSLAQNLWYFSKQARDTAMEASSICFFIDRGKECVGLVAEILALLEYGEPY